MVHHRMFLVISLARSNNQAARTHLRTLNVSFPTWNMMLVPSLVTRSLAIFPYKSDKCGALSLTYLDLLLNIHTSHDREIVVHEKLWCLQELPFDNMFETIAGPMTNYSLNSMLWSDMECLVKQTKHGSYHDKFGKFSTDDKEGWYVVGIVGMDATWIYSSIIEIFKLKH